MNLYDEEETKNENNHNKKTKKLIIVSIILLLILIAIIATLIIYMSYNPTKVTAYVNGVRRDDIVSLLDFQTDENGNTQVYIPIKDVAPYFGYVGYNGDYVRKSEDSSTCYVISEGYEVAMFTLKSNTIYKLNLQENSGYYDYCSIDRAVFESNGKLYTTVDGAQKGFNITFDYNESKRTITIYTLPSLATIYQKDLANRAIGSYGKVEIDERLSNWKSIFDGMLIVKAENQKYGVINTKDYSIILEPKYDGIEYIQYESDFLIKTNGKIGLLSKNGSTKISAVYDELTLMDRNSKLYRVEKNNEYGVINDIEEEIIYPEYQKIGIEIGDFATNGIKNGYILLDKLIPVQQGNKWGFFNLNGEMVSKDFLYDEIGCKASSGNNVFNLLAIEDYNVIVVGKDKKYSLMDIKGNDNVLRYGFVFDEFFMKSSAGNFSYWMKFNKRDWPVLDYLKRSEETE